MSYSSTGGLRDFISARTRTAALSSASSKPIQAPPGTTVTGVTTPSAPAASPGLFGNKLLVFAGIGALVIGGVIYYRKHKRPVANPTRRSRRTRYLAVLPSGKERIISASSEREAMKKAEKMSAVDLMLYDAPEGWD